MTYRKHPRHITNQQFADGTTIDGSRIDDAMRDVVEHVNEIPKGDLARRFVQTQYVAGWQPISPYNGAETHHMPWLPTINWPPSNTAATNIFSGSVVGSAPENPIKNRHRFKGVFVVGVHNDITTDDSTDLGTGKITALQWAWSRRFKFTSPAILHDIAIHMHTDRASGAHEPYRNDFEYDGPQGELPPGELAGDAARDLAILIDVAHPFTPEDTQMRSVVYLARGFGAADSAFSKLPLPPLSSGGAFTYTDMFPTFRGGANNDNCETVGGIMHRAHDLNIPIPERSRVRVAVVIPQYQQLITKSSWGEAVASPGTPSLRQMYESPWGTQSYSATLTVLEEIMSGKG
jgi:hypothetical protein